MNTRREKINNIKKELGLTIVLGGGTTIKDSPSEFNNGLKELQELKTKNSRLLVKIKRLRTNTL